MRIFDAALIAALVGGAVAFPLAVSAQTLDTIRETGNLRLGYRADAPPFSFRAGEEAPKGYSVALCRAVALSVKEQLNLDRLDVSFVEVSAEDRFQAIEDGKVDLLCGATSATLSRREQVDFSVPTFVDGAGILVLKGGPGSFRDLAGQKVGVRLGTTTETALRQAVEKMGIAIEIVPVEDHRDGIVRLVEKEIAGYFGDRAILFYLVLATGRDDFVLPEEQFTYEPYALALRKGDSAFRLAVDRALSRIYRSGAVAEIFRATFGPGAAPSPELRSLYRVNALPE